MAQLVGKCRMLAQRQVQLVFMDCFGHDQSVFCSLLKGPSPAEKETQVLASITAQEDKLKSWAEQNGVDLSADLAAGEAAIAAALVKYADGTTAATAP